MTVTTPNDKALMNKYKQLTPEQRYQMDALLTTQHEITQKEIAQRIGVHPSTVSRELKRYRQANPDSAQRYQATSAQLQTNQRREQAKKFTKYSDKLMSFIVKQMVAGWSPEQICGYLKRRSRGKIRLSPETIYQWLYLDQLIGGSGYTYLRRAKKLRQKRSSAYKRRSQIPNRISIHERPSEIETRTELGHFEGDTIVGKGKKTALVTLVERVSGITKIERVTQCAAEPVLHAILNMSQAIKISSLTLDNGKEFSKHESLTEQTDISVYFADPYSSWQRGTNENTNGLIRQYFRKGTDFAKVSDEQVKEVEDMLNNRPRKRLGYRTPNQVWREAMRSGNHSVALNT